MAKTPVTSDKHTSKTAAAAVRTASKRPRRIKAGAYQSFRLQKKIKVADKQPRLPGGFRLLRTALITVARNWKVFVGIAAVYGALTVVLVTGFSTADLSSTKDSLSQLAHGHLSQLGTSASLFVYLLGSGGNSANSNAGISQMVVDVVVSLALIWALRQAYAGNTQRVRDGFYKGMQPFVPFIFVLLMVGLELVPLGIGASLYGLVSSNSVAATAIEIILWAALLAMLALLSLYLICSSVFALYIVTLPDMTPRAALRSARQLVVHRRWTILRKLLFLPLVLVVLVALVMSPVVLFATAAAPWVFFALSTFLLVAVHGYLYTLYRALI